MTRALVTRLTQKRRAHLKKRRLRRSVRFMTVAAVFRDGLVFPKKRPAVFRMAARAGLVDGVLYKLRRRRGAMRRMAGSAGHFAFAQRMMRRLKKIGVLRLMTCSADLDLSDRAQHGVLGYVQRVTAHTRHVTRRVRARCPLMGRVRLVTAQAIRVLLSNRRGRFGAEDDHARWRATARLHMRAAGTVTGLALQTAVAEGAARIVRTRMFGAEQPRDRGIVVASEAGVRALRTIRRAGIRRGISRERVHGPAQQQGECAAHAST